MRVIVCGSRDVRDGATVLSIFERLSLLPARTVVVTGGANGVDWWANAIASAPYGPTASLCAEVVTADWEKHGRAAGPIRNREMLASGVDLVLAWPGGLGTADMIRAAGEAGVPVELMGG